MDIDIKVYTDGACWPNPGLGGWAAILTFTKPNKPVLEKVITGASAQSTNNLMEMTAVLESLRIFKQPSELTIYSDSQYVVQGIGSWENGEPIHKPGWVVGWKNRGWRRQQGALLNRDVWMQLHEEAIRHKRVTMKWVRGHDGHDYNERCDALAVQARNLLSEKLK